VRELVERWRRRARSDLGVAVMTDVASSTGIALALGPLDAAPDRGDPVLGVGRRLGGPRLEVYVK
jgi:hypothetical protein